MSAVRHSRMVVSLEAEASARPSPENASDQTPPVWPRSVARSSPLEGSHSLTVSSVERSTWLPREGQSTSLVHDSLTISIGL